MLLIYASIVALSGMLEVSNDASAALICASSLELARKGIELAPGMRGNAFAVFWGEVAEFLGDRSAALEARFCLPRLRALAVNAAVSSASIASRDAVFVRSD